MTELRDSNFQLEVGMHAQACSWPPAKPAASHCCVSVGIVENVDLPINKGKRFVMETVVNSKSIFLVRKQKKKIDSLRFSV